MDFDRFTAIRRYVEFTAECEGLLRRFLDVAGPELPRVVDDFYDAISRDPTANAVLTGGAEQVERLKSTLNQWLVTLLRGPFEEGYVASRNRIGQVHVRINLEQEYMLTAMNRVRHGLHAIARRSVPPGELPATLDALNRILDLDLALMLDTYREDWVTRVDASARLATVGQIAASIGHELRNPLGVAGSSLYLLRQRTNKLNLRDTVLDKHLERVEAQLRVCSEAITSLLEMVKDAPLVRSEFPVKPLLEECLQRTPRRDDIQVDVDVPDSTSVFADREQLASVLSNLLRNAFEAVESSAVKTVRCQASEHRGGIEMTIEDTGPGVDAAYRTRIFDVLFTTRARGTGLGLALCKKIVERHGGEIALVPDSNVGARFRVWLPSAPMGARDVTV
jgi:signal transduction histidine kinase